MAVKSLYAIKKFFGVSTTNEDKAFSYENIELDSRKITSKDIFLVKKGTTSDGLDFIDDVIKKGVSLAIIAPRPDRKAVRDILDKKNINYLFLTNTKPASRFASWFYDNPSKRIRLIGVTGTNGKSTITTLVATMLNAIGFKCAVFGTIGYGFLGNLEKANNTTLDEVYLNRELNKYIALGAEFAALEVSSIGIVQGRIDYLSFSIGAFTNLTRDHLDFHKSMENYKEAKRNFLDRIANTQHIIVNSDDPVGREFAEAYENCTCYGLEKSVELANLKGRRFVLSKSVSYKDDGFSLTFSSSYGQSELIDVKLLGKFNVSNYLCAVAILQNLNISLKSIKELSKAIKPINGRMECFYKKGKPRIIVDYAHTPDGVESALKAARCHCHDGKIICVIGCGGDRDKGKRPIMAIKSCVFANWVIFTNDNPRTEDPMSIIDDMLLGVEKASNKEVIFDRAEAIKKAFSLAGANDCVLIAGKGHEDYQILKDETIHFSDREQACALLGINCD